MTTATCCTAPCGRVRKLLNVIVSDWPAFINLITELESIGNFLSELSRRLHDVLTFLYHLLNQNQASLWCESKPLIMSAIPGDAHTASFVDISSLKATSRQKVDEFIRIYEEKLGCKPSFVIRAPGRVNLIGDHIDYHGFSVLPMAIEKCILLGCHFDEKQLGDNSSIRLINGSPLYENWTGKHTFSYGANLDKNHNWHNYILCGYHGVLVNSLLGIEPNKILNHASLIASDIPSSDDISVSLSSLHNFTAFIESDLPVASGLSSSSALICASSIAATLLLHRSLQLSDSHLVQSLDSQSMAEKCSYFEHLIGTQGGGMDQAVIMTAQVGYAKFVQFIPKLTCQNVRLPSSAIWLVSHCGSSYPKAATRGFNTRVLETKLGAALIAKVYQIDTLTSDRSITLGKVRGLVFDDIDARSILTKLREEVFKHKTEYTIKEVCSSLAISQAELASRFNISKELFEVHQTKKLKIALRCEHIFEEAERVEKFKTCCEAGTDLGGLGKLMLESHISLRDKYECSHPDLDRLVDVAQRAGALGSRLTGAGWGGCIVTLVAAPQVQAVSAALEEVAKFTFHTEPQAGCTIMSVPAD